MLASLWKLIARVTARPAVADWLIRRSRRTPYSPIQRSPRVARRPPLIETTLIYGVFIALAIWNWW